MMCPYWTGESNVVEQTRFEYDEEGRETFREVVSNKINRALACAKGECGAWVTLDEHGYPCAGHCGYVGVVG